MKLNILGTEYTLERHKEYEDDRLHDCGGYCDYNSRKLVVQDFGTEKPWTLDHLEDSMLLNTRHEIMHAFFQESGLGSDSVFGQNEELVGWLAIQLPKIVAVMRNAGCLE